MRRETFEPGDGSFEVHIDSLDELKPGDDHPAVVVWYGRFALARHYIRHLLREQEQRERR